MRQRSGGGTRSQPTATHYDTYHLAPITLASDVSSEETTFRRKPSGVIPLWACAGSPFTLSDWDRQRQAVRGRIELMDEDVLDALTDQLAPRDTSAPAGAGAIPAAPSMFPDPSTMKHMLETGAPPPTAAAPKRDAPLAASPGAWCVHLDHRLDAHSAAKNARESALVFLIMLPIICAGAMLIVVAMWKK